MSNTKHQYLKKHIFKPFVIHHSSQHTMGVSLEKYVNIKIHHLIQENDYDEIRIVGEHDRTNSIISKLEKNDKITNWQRPTAHVEDNILYLKCFPGVDYIRHYSSLVSSHLAMSNRNYSHVSYTLPDESECWDAVQSIGLEQVPIGDVVVVGHGLPTIAETNQWNGNQSILWHSKKIGSKKVTFLIVQFSFWGDILRRIVNILASRGAETVIFTAKVGGIDKVLTPNIDIVTGDNSFVGGEIIASPKECTETEGHQDQKDLGEFRLRKVVKSLNHVNDLSDNWRGCYRFSNIQAMVFFVLF